MSAVYFSLSTNPLYMGGFPIGFWFAQQGSIVVFIFLILAYCLIMDRIDASFSNESESN